MVDVKPDGCWLWAGFTSGGYGRVNRSVAGVGHVYQAHRVSYETLRGRIPDGLVLDHLCRVKRCVNPDHLEPVSQATNIARGEWFVATNGKKSKCPNGHTYDEANTYVIPSTGGRMCRACKAAARAAENERRRARRHASASASRPVLAHDPRG